jgi:FkbM family methyltransferase
MTDRDLPFGAYAPKGILSNILNVSRSLPNRGAGKRLGFALRKLGTPLLNGQPVDVESFGAKFRLLPYNNVCESRILFFPRLFDEEEREFIRSRMTDSFTFLDIGANIGGYSLFVAAHAGPRARILAIEPMPDIFNRLVANIRFNPFGTIKALAMAVADKDEERTLFVDTANNGESSLKIVNAAGATSIRVPARKLLTILNEEGFEKLDAIKLDVEGAEDLILDAFFAQAPEHLYPGLIVIESTPSRWQSDLMGTLANHGYVRVGETRNNYILERKRA